MSKNKKSSKPTSADAELIMRLYDLRREPEMRKARDFITRFFPESMDDLRKVITAFGTPENAWMRQVSSYWEMAASFVNSGVLDHSLFFQNSSEMIVLFVKLKPFLKQLREEFRSPDILANIERVAMATPKSRERVRLMEERMSQWKAMMRAAAAAS